MADFTESKDGTRIAYDVSGDGTPIVITGGAFNTRMSPGPLVGMLDGAYKVVTWDRRGRGDSGNTLPYAIEREVEDLEAVIKAVGGDANAYGHSSGAILVLEAAMRGVQMRKIAVYEPPYLTGNSEAMAGVQTALDDGDPSLAAITFIKGTGAENTDGLTQSPWWGGMVALAETLPYDLALTGDGEVPTARLTSIVVPTLVMDGGDSPDWAANTAVAIGTAVPNADRVTLEGQTHNVAPEALEPILLEFFA